MYILQANRDYVAAALDIAGGQIGIFKVSSTIIQNLCTWYTFFLVQLANTGRQDTDEILMFQNSVNIMDFVFDPFDNLRLVVGMAQSLSLVCV